MTATTAQHITRPIAYRHPTLRTAVAALLAAVATGFLAMALALAVMAAAEARGIDVNIPEPGPVPQPSVAPAGPAR
jgi:hypothetical protein